MLYAITLSTDGLTEATRIAVMSDKTTTELAGTFRAMLDDDSTTTVDVQPMGDLYYVCDTTTDITTILAGPKTTLVRQFPDAVITPAFLKQRPILSPNAHPT